MTLKINSTGSDYGQPENPHRQIVRSETFGFGDAFHYTSPDWKQFDKDYPKLPLISKDGTPYLKIGVVEVEKVWQVCVPETGIWHTCHVEPSDFAPFDTRQVYIVKENQETPPVAETATQPISHNRENGAESVEQLAEIDRLKKALDYNVYLSTRFMQALFKIANVTPRPYEIPLNQWLSTLDICIDTAKAALVTKTFSGYNANTSTEAILKKVREVIQGMMLPINGTQHHYSHNCALRDVLEALNKEGK